jgi:hypothetical protein
MLTDLNYFLSLWKGVDLYVHCIVSLGFDVYMQLVPRLSLVNFDTSAVQKLIVPNELSSLLPRRYIAACLLSCLNVDI